MAPDTDEHSSVREVADAVVPDAGHGFDGGCKVVVVDGVVNDQTGPLAELEPLLATTFQK